jgi:hypothetical protein
MNKMGNLLSLLDDPIPPEKIPEYPKFDLLIAKGGEKTFDIPDECKFADGKQVIPYEREAVKGEVLRNVSMEYRIDNTKNMFFRGERLRECANNPRARELEMAYCASSILYFFNVYGWTFSPKQGTVPFITYPFQDDILTWWLWLVKLELSGLVEKSRKLGLSWLSQGIIAYLGIFNPDFISYEFSMTENEVDNRRGDSLFGKLRIFLTGLPEWMRRGWVEFGKDSNGETTDKKMDILFPENKSAVSGKLSGGQGGRSGRSNLNVYDEMAHIEQDEELLDASTSMTDTEIYISTVKGMANAFARIAHEPGTFKKSPHYTEHPLKDDKWAILERSNTKYTVEKWAQEMDISYETSTSGRVYQMFKSRANKGEWSHVQETSFVDYDPNYDVYVGLDFGLSDPNSVVYMQKKPMPTEFQNILGDCLVIFDEDENRDQFDDKLAKMLLDKSYIYTLLVGDMRTGERRNSDGTTLIQNVGKYGLNIVGRYNSADAPIKAVKKRLEFPGAFVINKQRCPKMVTAMQNWAFDRINKATGLPESGAKPDHSAYSHLNKALAYLIDYMEGGTIEKRRHKKSKNWNFNPINKAML